MPLHSIKKQKSNIARERKKLVGCDEFRHPLAYQPTATGREAAVKKYIKSAGRGTMDMVTNTNQKRSFTYPRKTVKPENSKISSDRSSVSFFASRMQPTVSGKRGGHVSDIFMSDRASAPKQKNDLMKLDFSKPFHSTYGPPESYHGYKGEASLKIQIKSDRNEIKNRLGDPEMDNRLPEYSREDILGLATDRQRPTTDNNADDNFLPKDFDPYGTTVKLSFAKTEKKESEIEKKPGARKLEEEESVTGHQQNSHTPPAPSNSLRVGHPSQERTSPKLTATTSPHPQVNNLIAYSSGLVADEEEEEPATVKSYLHDYTPVFAPTITTPIKQKSAPREKILKPLIASAIKNPLKKIWQKIKNKELPFRESNRVINMEFMGDSSPRDYGYAGTQAHGNTSYQAEYEIDTVKQSDIKNSEPPSFWSNQVFTQKEELVVRGAEEGFQKFWINFKNLFLVFRSPQAKRSAVILGVGVIFSLMIPVGAYVQKVIETKSKIEEQSNEAYRNIYKAKSAAFSAKPEEAQKNFGNAYQNFLTAGNSLDEINGTMLSIIKILPGGRKIQSGENLLEGGKHLSAGGQIISEAFDIFLGEQGALKKKFLTTDNLSTLKEVSENNAPTRNDRAENLTSAIIIFQDKLNKSKIELEQATSFLDRVKINDLPEDKREGFVLLQEKLPTAIKNINNFSSYTNIILSVLGHNKSRQYLFLFENNDEIRATGGFIGTYGIVKLNEGNVSQLYIDGIYNPDGQLKERVIPPKPIQKMSATWSMHDANWWPDFPKSAEKVAWFYEKTGGPAVDGVIAFTPKLMEELLKITGPINHEKYNTVVSADNFVDITQNKVETEYDKKLNRPKQFLADLAPIVLEKIMQAPPEKWIEVMGAFSNCLEDRSVIMYFFDNEAQKTVSDLGWSGEILDTPKDFLSVINTNISGFKTDRVIEQKISHSAEIKTDGSIADTITITRAHKGGKEKYDWYNAVNSDWLRVYVPKGSELLHAEGQTREVDSPPVDYAKLGFIEDEMVTTEENGTTIDPYTGTRIYEDSGKTVFANWTYVSPGETLTLKYTYLLPFKLRFDDIKKPADTYSLLVQKQAGDENSWVISEVKGLENFDSLYHYPDNIGFPQWKIEEKFNKDIFAGVVLAPKGEGKKLQEQP